MAFWVFETRISLAFVALKIGMNKFNEAVQVFRRHGFVLLVEIVDVSVQDLDKKFNRNRSIHTCIGHPKSALKTLKDSFPIAI